MGLYRAAPFGDSIGYNIDYGGPGGYGDSSLPPTKSEGEVIVDIISNPAAITAAGVVTTAAGIYSKNGEIIAVGITTTDSGGALLFAEILGGNTSAIPYDYGLLNGIVDTLTGKKNINTDPCKD